MEPRTPLKVLLIEDSEDDAALEILELKRSGFAPASRRADTMEQVEAALLEERWDVVLCDHGLPAFSSRDAFRMLRERGLDVPTIIVSGQIGEDAAIEAMKGGAVDYVLKGNLRRLGPAVKGALRESEDRRRLARAEDELRLEAALRRSMVDNAVHGMFRWIPGGRLLSGNPALAAMLGFPSVEELLAVGVVGGFFVDPAEGEAFAADCSRPGRVERVQTRWKRRDGRTVWVRLSATSYPGSGDGGLVVDGIAEDVTGLHSLEEQFLHAQKMEAVGRLAGSVAHDFNNLLTVIQGYAGFLQAGLEAGSRPRLWAEEIRKASDRAASLTKQLLAFSRRQEANPRVVEIDRILADCAGMMGRLVPASVHLVVVPAGRPLRVKIDPGHFDQVIANLVVNARDAMPQGGALRLASDEVRVEPEVRGRPGSLPAGAFARISVSDTGIGMTPEVMERIFEPFFTTKSKDMGTGLGLATVYALVERAGGRVQVASTPGEGTTFTILLPLTDEAPQPGTAPASRPPSAGRETVLLAEDEPVVRELLAGELRAAGYTVLAARDGEEALAVSRGRSGPLDILVTDLSMPGMSGRALAERLRAERPGLRVLWMSGYSDESGGRSGPAAPVSPFLQKPFRTEALLAEVRRILDEPAPGA